MATKLTCGDSRIGATALAIYQNSTTPPFVELLDVSNPQKPYLACTLSPAFGAHLLSDTKLAFWVGDELGTADLASGAIRRTGRVAARGGTAAFSTDGTKFAYRHWDDAGSMSLHLYVGGSDKTLYVREPMGGHGGPGPSFGPFDQLVFSPDGSLLLDRYAFGMQTMTVYRSDGSIAFQTVTGTNGLWSPSGNTLYFLNFNELGPTLFGDLHSWSAAGEQPVALNLNGFFWPRVSPDGSGIVYNASDSSVPDCGGVPHLWRLDLNTRRATQISKAISSGPFFIQPNVVWSDEQKLTACGPGGPSTPDGVILAHDLRTGKDTTVDTTLLVPGIGGPSLPPASTYNLLDTWFAPA
jgi:Tol biopolymer transport system component